MTTRALLGLAAVALAACAGASCSSEGTELTSAGSDGGSPDGALAVGTGALAAKGAAFVLQRDCAQCHQGDGDGILSGASTPARGSVSAFPKNLTPDPDTGIDGWTDDDYTRAILDGVDDHGLALCSPMPQFRTLGMTDAEALAIAAYLRSLPPVHHSVPESTCARPAADAGSDAASDASASDGAGDAASDAAGDAGSSDARAE